MSRASKYTYPGTDVLINHFDIRDRDVLQLYEQKISKIKLAELAMNPIKGNFDLNHLQSIHKYIFQDIYPFAGQIREEDIAKDQFSFAKALYIEDSAKHLFHQLAKEQYFKGLGSREFAEKAADLMAEINVLHPFREGNGRTQREFIRELALQAGHSLSWSRVDQKELLQASIRSITNPTHLAKLIEQSLIPNTDQEPSRWIESSSLLKDVLKKGEGIPVGLSADELNKTVRRYYFESNNKLFYQLSDNKTKVVHMEQFPFMSKQLQNAIIDQAAQQHSLQQQQLER